MLKNFTPLLLLVLLPANIEADQRHFVWTYEYMSMHRGEAELEYYHTVKWDPDGKYISGVSLQTELEIGMTDHFDMGFYNVFSYDSTSGIGYDGFKIRSRYRLGERGKWFVDPLLYAEYKRDAQFEEHELELKLILGRSRGNWYMAYNPIFEIEFEEDETETKFEHVAGLGYQFFKHWGAGLELKVEPDHSLLGPTLSHGGEHLWMSLGYLFPTSDDHGSEWRLIIGIGL